MIVCFCSELERYLQKNKCNVELDRTAEVCFSRIVIFFTLSLKASSFQRTNSSLKDTFKHRRLDFFFFFFFNLYDFVYLANGVTLTWGSLWGSFCDADGHGQI